jgi:hypothetical protein
VSQRCPHCRLYNPDSATRCDCGYDFQEKRVAESYLVAHIEQKHGGRSNLLRSLARDNLLGGALLMALGVALAVANGLMTGRASVPFLLIWPVILLARGLRQRRQATSLAVSLKEKERLKP